MAQLHKKISLLCCFLGSFFLLTGQSSLKVVTKKVEKTFTYKTGYELNIEGEKAEISVQSWNEDKVLIEMELIAENTDRAVAEKEVEKIIYEMERHKNRIYARNYVDSKEGKPASSLSVRYSITMPRECPIYIKNNLGEVLVSDLSSSLKVNSQFSPIGLENITGFIEVRTRFGDVNGQAMDGDINVYSRRSDITLSDLKGMLNLESQYGEIHLARFAKLTGMNIQAEKSNVFLDVPNFDAFAYFIESQNSKLRIPNDLDFDYKVNNDQLKKIEFKPNREYYATVSIQITFGDLTIEKKN